MRAPTRTRPAPLLAAAAAAAVLALTGCGAGDDAGGDDGGGDSAGSAERGTVAAEAPPEAAMDAVVGSTARRAAENAGDPTTPGVAERAVVSTATVSLLSDDVADARFDVQKVVDRLGGEVADEKTDAGDDVRRSRLVLRIPTERFDEAVAALQEVGELESASQSTKDVTTQVIDVAARVRAQERSLRRVELLLDRAVTIRDVVRIEEELTRRQMELDSLKGQQAYLADQTELSTITVHIERTPERRPGADERDDAGFLGGLEDGWSALKGLGSGVATVAGALLPFVVVLLVLGLPLWPLLRVLRRRLREHPAEPVEPAAS